MLVWWLHTGHPSLLPSPDVGNTSIFKNALLLWQITKTMGNDQNNRPAYMKGSMWITICYYWNYREGLTKTTVKILGLQAVIRTRDPPNTNQTTATLGWQCIIILLYSLGDVVGFMRALLLPDQYTSILPKYQNEEYKPTVCFMQHPYFSHGVYEFSTKCYET